MTSPHIDYDITQSFNVEISGMVFIELLDQFSDSIHKVKIKCRKKTLSFKCIDGAIEGDIDGKNWGKPKFYPLDFLTDDDYFEDDICNALIFLSLTGRFPTMSHDHNTSIYSISNTCNFLYDGYPSLVSPVIFNLTNFDKRFNNHEMYFSDPFYTIEQEARIVLRVDVAGSIGHFMSVHLYFIKSKYDYKRELSYQQPLTGTFTVELLNQLHHSNYKVNLSIGKYTDGCICDDEFFMPHYILFTVF